MILFTKILNRVKTSSSQIPPAVRNFFVRTLLLFFIWKAVYLLFLLPSRLVDDPLTNSVGIQTVWLLNQIYPSAQFTAKPFMSSKYFEGQMVNSSVSRIDLKGEKIMFIADGCNGLELFILYIGFIIVMPASVKRKTYYILLGVLIIHLINILRCFGLANIHIYLNPYFSFAHHYVFKMVVYGSIFVLWIIFSRKLNFKSLD